MSRQEFSQSSYTTVVLPEHSVGDSATTFENAGDVDLPIAVVRD
jgi:hypothetical protein